MSTIRQTLRAALALGMPRRWLLVKNAASTGGICLTFDDGPHPEHTPILLDALREHGVTATFFVIGEQAEKYPHLVRRIAAEGHVVAQHSYFHTEPRATPPRQLMREVERTTKLLQEILGPAGGHCPLFRPPKGELTVGKMIALRRAGMNVVLWNVDPKDYKIESAEALAAWFTAHPVQAGDIVLMHDVKPCAASVIGQLAAAARSAGLRFAHPLSPEKSRIAAHAATL